MQGLPVHLVRVRAPDHLPELHLRLPVHPDRHQVVQRQADRPVPRHDLHVPVAR